MKNRQSGQGQAACNDENQHAEDDSEEQVRKILWSILKRLEAEDRSIEPINQPDS